eukprot:7381046-Prymnesium_polylepis.1
MCSTPPPERHASLDWSDQGDVQGQICAQGRASLCCYRSSHPRSGCHTETREVQRGVRRWSVQPIHGTPVARPSAVRDARNARDTPTE